MKISDGLIYEQNVIIESSAPKIVISAGPGAGKTYTIIKKAAKELKELELSSINKGVVLCSFTREASFELEKRLQINGLNEFTYIGTIDSFILTDIINPFKNRILKRIKPGSNYITSKLKISIPPLDKNLRVNVLTRQGITDDNKNEIIQYYKSWIDNLTNGRYEVSFAAYMFASQAIEKVPEVQQYIKTRYKSIYIDESQDLNDFQIRFIKKIIGFTNINCYLIGDKRQSIYSFRGAKPELFYSMIENGFVEMKITHSARCHYNILEFSRRIVGESHETKKLVNDNRVIINYSILNNIGVLKKYEDYFVLVESNVEAENIYKKCLENDINNVVYTKRIEIKSDKEFSDNYYDISEEIIKFYYNHNNIDPSLTYSIEELTHFLQNIIDLSRLKASNLIIGKGESVIEYLMKIFYLGSVSIPDHVQTEIKSQLDNEVYRNHYIRVKHINRIMTIHSSKGLEANYVFVQFERKNFNLDEEHKRKLFVAFTRAKERLVIGFTGETRSQAENYINQCYTNTFE